MGLDNIDLQAIAEGQALSDARKAQTRKRRSNNNRYRYRTQESEFRRTDNGWRRLVKRAMAQEL